MVRVLPTEAPAASARLSEEMLAGLLAATHELGRAADLRSGLSQVAAELRRFVPYDHLGVLLLDELGRELRFELAVGIAPEVAAAWRFGLGQGIVGTAAKTGEAILARDVRADPRYIDAGASERSELALPLRVRGRTIGVLDLGSAHPDAFTAEHQRLLSLLADHLANAIETARLYQNTRDLAQGLSLLHEVSREMISILDRRLLMEKVATLVQRLIDYDLFCVLLWNEEARLLEPTLSVYRHGPDVCRIAPMALGHGLCGTSAALRQPIRSPNVHLDPRFVHGSMEMEVNSELVVPLVFKDRLMGVLDLESSRYDAFSARDEQLLSTLASSVAIALENADLYGKLQAEEERLASDLKTAREIQKQLLPKASPCLPGVQVGFAYEPARHLGGDFYDFLPYGRDRLALAVGDVAGKATPAALYGSLAIGMLREVAARDSTGPAATLQTMNERLCQLGIGNRFLAMAFAVFDAADRSLTLASSGLPHPYLVRGSSVRRLEVQGVPLGLLPGQTYREERLTLAPGDALVIASDGVEEAIDPGGEEFARERCEAALSTLGGGTASEIAEGLLAACRRHAGSAEPSDDRTVVVLKTTL